MSRFRKYFAVVSSFLLAIGLSPLLVYIKLNSGKIWQDSILSQTNLDHELKYQLITLGIAVAVILISLLLRPDNFKSFFRMGDKKAEIVPVKYLGIKPKENETWRQMGIQFAIIITLVTAVVIYLQVIRGNNISSSIVSYIPWILLFSLMNSFTEEMIFRFNIVNNQMGVIDKRAIPIISGAIFGGVHYFGNPGGIPGVLVAGFLGWFLAKSLIETRGIFWAWLIHFLQDIVIFTGLFIAL